MIDVKFDSSLDEEDLEGIRGRYDEVRQLKGWRVFETYQEAGQTVYEGTCPVGVNEEDIVIYFTKGDTRFSGSVGIDYDERDFICVINTD